MRKMMLLFLTLFALSCSAAPDGPPPERLANAEQALNCWGPDGYQASGLVLAPVTVQRAHFLVNKMWGAWPKAPTCYMGVCPPSVPQTCNAAQCAAGACPGWTCQQTAINYADDGLRMSTTVAGTALVDDRFALQPDVRWLTSLETTELGATRAATVLLTDFWCSEL